MNSLIRRIMYKFTASLLFLSVLFFEEILGVILAIMSIGIFIVFVSFGIKSTSIICMSGCFIASVIICIFLIRLTISIIFGVLHTRVWSDNNFYLKKYFKQKMYGVINE